jgi:hypothetical protein
MRESIIVALENPQTVDDGDGEESSESEGDEGNPETTTADDAKVEADGAITEPAKVDFRCAEIHMFASRRTEVLL